MKGNFFLRDNLCIATSVFNSTSKAGNGSKALALSNLSGTFTLKTFSHPVDGIIEVILIAKLK